MYFLGNISSRLVARAFAHPWQSVECFAACISVLFLSLGGWGGRPPGTLRSVSYRLCGDAQRLTAATSEARWDLKGDKKLQQPTNKWTKNAPCNFGMWGKLAQDTPGETSSSFDLLPFLSECSPRWPPSKSMDCVCIKMSFCSTVCIAVCSTCLTQTRVAYWCQKLDAFDLRSVCLWESTLELVSSHGMSGEPAREETALGFF